MIISVTEEEIDPQSEIEPDLDQMAQKVQDLLKFKSFYDQMDFNPEQRLAITIYIWVQVGAGCPNALSKANLNLQRVDEISPDPEPKPEPNFM